MLKSTDPSSICILDLEGATLKIKIFVSSTSHVFSYLQSCFFSTLQVLVMHTQLGGDMEFVTQLLGAGPSTSSQQGCDSRSSDSEFNCSDIINASDSDDTGSRNRSFNNLHQNSRAVLFLMLWTHRQS